MDRMARTQVDTQDVAKGTSWLEGRKVGQACKDMNIALIHQTSSQLPRIRINTEETKDLRNSGQSLKGFEMSEGSTNAMIKYVMFNNRSCVVKSAEDEESVISSLTNEEESWRSGHCDSVLITCVQNHPTQRAKYPPMKASIQYDVSQRHPFSRMEKIVITNDRYDEEMRSKCSQIKQRIVNRPSTVQCNDVCPFIKKVSDSSSILSSGISKNSSSLSSGSHRNLLGRFNDNQSNHFSEMRICHDKLLAGCRQRLHRGTSLGTEIHVGSIVGESTLLTSPLSTSSNSVAETSVLRRGLRPSHFASEPMVFAKRANEGFGCCQVRKSKNIIKSELKYVAKKLSQPIKKMSIFKEKKAELMRSTGNLV